MQNSLCLISSTGIIKEKEGRKERRKEGREGGREGGNKAEKEGGREGKGSSQLTYKFKVILTKMQKKLVINVLGSRLEMSKVVWKDKNRGIF
jgi:hypothetical protein